MIEKFRPDIYVKSIFTIDYDKLKEKNIKCILFDLDNTLVPISKDKPTKKVKDLVNELKEKGFHVIILSNSLKERVKPFKDILEVDAACMSMKPLKRKYNKILNTFNYNPEDIAVVGDQLLTDILGGNKMKLTTILVNPISKKDFKITSLNRLIEKFLFNRLEKKELFYRGKYYD